MLMNYHEMTRTQAKDDPQRRMQFLTICAVMFACFVYTALTSGALVPIDPTVGYFPGGLYCYKFTSRDYAASMGLGRSLQRDLTKEEGGDAIRKIEAKTYHTYLDNPWEMGGRRQRFMSGIMVYDKETDEAGMKQVESLMTKSESLVPIDPKDYPDYSAREVFDRLKYETADLPKDDALVLNFPFTNGFVSALMFSYRILPSLRKIAIEKGVNPDDVVVISNCSKDQEMCTHYVPLKLGRQFFAGRPASKVHVEALGPEKFVDMEGIKKGFDRVNIFKDKKKDEL